MSRTVAIDLEAESRKVRTPGDFRALLRKIEAARSYQMKAGGWRCPACDAPVVTRVFPDPNHPRGGKSISCCNSCFWTQTWDFLVQEGRTAYEEWSGRGHA